MDRRQREQRVPVSREASVYSDERLERTLSLPAGVQCDADDVLIIRHIRRKRGRELELDERVVGGSRANERQAERVGRAGV